MAIAPTPTRAASALGPAEHLRAVTPSDAADLPDGATRGLFVGVAGSLRVVGRDGVEATIVSLGSQYHPIRVSRVLASGTTAGQIVALY